MRMVVKMVVRKDDDQNGAEEGWLVKMVVRNILELSKLIILTEEKVGIRLLKLLSMFCKV